MTRYVLKNDRVYVEGRDMSGYARTVGEIGTSFDAVMPDPPPLTDTVKGVELGQATAVIGPINANLDDTTDGMHKSFSGNDGNVVDILFARGGLAAPAIGAITFAVQSVQAGYQATRLDAGSMVAINMTLSPWTTQGASLLYDNFWGVLLAHNTARTAVNSGTSGHDYGAQTTKGGWAMFQLLSSNGTVTLSVQDSSTDVDGNFSGLISSGSLDASSSPKSAVVALAKTATVERYTRWQLAFGTASTATFLIAFNRAIR